MGITDFRKSFTKSSRSFATSEGSPSRSVFSMGGVHIPRSLSICAGVAFGDERLDASDTDGGADTGVSKDEDR